MIHACLALAICLQDEVPPLTPDAPVIGEIDDSSPRVEGPGVVTTGAETLLRGQTHVFDAPEGTWTLELRAELFDSFLIVRDAGGALVAADDDGLGGTDARVLVEVPEGGKRLDVIVCAQRLGTGEYELRAVAGDAPLPVVAELTLEELAVLAQEAFEEHGLGSDTAVVLVQRKAWALYAQRRYGAMLQLAEPALALLDARDPEHEQGRARLLEITAIAKTSLVRYLEAARDWRECAPVLTSGPESADQRNASYNAANTMWRAGWYEEGRQWAELAWELGERQLPEDSGERELLRDLRFSYLRFAGSWDDYLASLDEPILLEPGTVHEGEIPANRRLYQSTPTIVHGYSLVSTVDPLPFRVAESGIYTIDMRSYVFDPFLVLRDADGRLLAEDDDSRGFTEARLVVELEAGAVYLLEPTALHWRAGPYRVQLLAGEPPVTGEWEKRQDVLAEARASLSYAEEAEARGDPYGLALNRAADLFAAIGQTVDVVRVRELALELALRRNGEDSRSANMARYRLALALQEDGHHAEALPLLQSVHDFELRMRGSRERLPWQLLEALAKARWDRAEYELADELFEIVDERVAIEHGADSFEAKLRLHRRALRAYIQTRLAKAIEYEREFVAWLEEASPQSPGLTSTLAVALFWLAEMESWVPGGIEASRIHAERALELYERAGHDPRSDLINLYVFDLCYTGEPDRAVQEWIRMGPEDANQFSTGADIYACLGDKDRAFELALRAADMVIEERASGSRLGELPEALRLRKRGFRGWNVGMLVGIGSLAPGFEAAVYERILALKALTGRSSVETRERVLADADDEVLALVDELRGIQAELARAFYGDEGSEYLERLRERRLWLEDQLALAGIQAGHARRASVAELSAALPHGTVLVDFHSTSVYEPQRVAPGEAVTPLWWTEKRVSAWVLGAGDDEIALVDLGPTDELEALAHDLGGALVAARGVQAESPKGAGGRRNELRQRLWDPIAPLVGDARRVFVSTTEFLGSVPLEVLQRDDGSFLVEHHAFVHLADALQLLDMDEAPVEREPSLLLVGDVDYEARDDGSGPGRSHPAEGPLVAFARAPDALRGPSAGGWQRLPFTNAEVERLGEMFSRRMVEAETTRLTGTRATEEALKAALPAHSWVHIATHGFFQPEGTVARDTSRDIAGLFPGLLSGLVLAGANTEPPDDREDGLLTAEELTWLDLTDCELVTLSACETGLGSARGGAGLIGLRRALHQAGAKTVVASLWTVEDQATAELMDSFYHHLWVEGATRSDALRAAQLEMLERNREQGDPRPSTWGAFVLSGEWR